MNETINLMNAHTSVRRFTEEQISDKELHAIINAGRAASSWKNFQSYSIIVVRSKEKKKPSLTWCLKKPFGSLQPSCFLLVISIVPKKAFTCIRKTFILREQKIS